MTSIQAKIIKPKPGLLELVKQLRLCVMDIHCFRPAREVDPSP